MVLIVSDEKLKQKVPEEYRLYFSEIKHPENLPKELHVYQGERGGLYIDIRELHALRMSEEDVGAERKPRERKVESKPKPSEKVPKVEEEAVVPRFGRRRVALGKIGKVDVYLMEMFEEQEKAKELMDLLVQKIRELNIERFLDGLSNIEIFQSKEDFLGKETVEMIIYYDGVSKTISVYDLDKKITQEKFLIFVHVLGHHVWDEFLSEEMKYGENGWTKIWSRNANKIGKTTNMFALVDYHEGFAECFVLWVLKEKLPEEVQNYFDMLVNEVV